VPESKGAPKGPWIISMIHNILWKTSVSTIYRSVEGFTSRMMRRARRYLSWAVSSTFRKETAAWDQVSANPPVKGRLTPGHEVMAFNEEY
jgi:hypothetical protein